MDYQAGWVDVPSIPIDSDDEEVQTTQCRLCSAELERNPGGARKCSKCKGEDSSDATVWLSCPNGDHFHIHESCKDPTRQLSTQVQDFNTEAERELKTSRQKIDALLSVISSRPLSRESAAPMPLRIDSVPDSEGSFGPVVAVPLPSLGDLRTLQEKLNGDLILDADLQLAGVSVSKGCRLLDPMLLIKAVKADNTLLVIDIRKQEDLGQGTIKGQAFFEEAKGSQFSVKDQEKLREHIRKVGWLADLLTTFRDAQRSKMELVKLVQRAGELEQRLVGGMQPCPVESQIELDTLRKSKKDLCETELVLQQLFLNLKGMNVQEVTRTCFDFDKLKGTPRPQERGPKNRSSASSSKARNRRVPPRPAGPQKRRPQQRSFSDRFRKEQLSNGIDQAREAFKDADGQKDEPKEDRVNSPKRRKVTTAEENGKTPTGTCRGCRPPGTSTSSSSAPARRVFDEPVQRLLSQNVGKTQDRWATGV